MSLERPQAPDPYDLLPAKPSFVGFNLAFHTPARGVIRPLFSA